MDENTDIKWTDLTIESMDDLKKQLKNMGDPILEKLVLDELARGNPYSLIGRLLYTVSECLYFADKFGLTEDLLQSMKDSELL